MALQSGAIIAERYRLTRHLATGGMGAVWEGLDLRLDRQVAVKVLKPEFAEDAEFLERFRAEARTTAQLNHPGIAGIFDYGETADPQGTSVPYLVMELVRGEPLNAVIRRMGTVPVDLVLDMLEQSGHALQAAHSAGLVHRDVKPGNIMITPTGQVKLTDFGIAKVVDDAPVTRTGMVMGTVQYIAPEQALGQDATAASDVYSLGVVGYEALTGSRPFRADTTVAIAQKHIGESPPDLPESVPPQVRELIAITLTKDPAQRYRDGGEFAQAVASVRSGRRPPRPRGAAAGAPTEAAPARTSVLPAVTGGFPPPTAAQPAPIPAAAADGWSTSQKVLAWSAALVLLAAAMITGGILFANAVSDDASGGNPATPAPPAATTTAPDATTQQTTAAPTTTRTTEPATTRTTTRTTAPTTEPTTTSTTTRTTQPTPQPTTHTTARNTNPSPGTPPPAEQNTGGTGGSGGTGGTDSAAAERGTRP